MSSETILPDVAFSREQKEYLQGYFAGLACSGMIPFVGHLPDGRITNVPTRGLVNSAAEPEALAEETVNGTPVSDLCEQEIWKLEEHGLDVWDKLVAHAAEDKFPDKPDTFRFRYHGLFYVAPAQKSFMLRCRIPAGEMTSMQLRGLADLAEEWGGGYADITTRANFQVREIAPRNMVKCLLKLQEIGLTSRGSGVDNVRNITATPTAGIDKDELIDTRPFAKALHHYILNNRDMYDLPRKFNVAFDGAGSITTVADTNDIGFIAVRVPDGKGVEPGIYFRVELAGITGHQQFAKDSGVLVKPGQCVAVAAAIIRVFIENGDRTNRKRARLKYVIDKWGIPKYIEEVKKKLAFPLLRLPLDQCEPRKAPIQHGHIGVFKQVQPGLNYIGAVMTVGRMKPKQMRRIADVAQNYGSGEIRLTVWQNLLIPNVPDHFVETVKKNLVKMGFHHSATSISGGLIACTGNIMVGSGTGIAPFRAFLEERKATGAQGGNWLFFGAQKSSFDFFYKEELETYQTEGVLTRFDTAFSRDRNYKIYVQTRMMEKAKKLWNWLEQGAHFYVCGDASRMAKDVDKALHEIVKIAGDRSEEAAGEYIQKLKCDKRYQRDVY